VKPASLAYFYLSTEPAALTKSDFPPCDLLRAIFAVRFLKYDFRRAIFEVRFLKCDFRRAISPCDFRRATLPYKHCQRSLVNISSICMYTKIG
jgi:hypothetical protein